MDANEDLSNGPLIKKLKKIKLRDYVRDRTKIDVVFASVNTYCGGGSFFPFWVGIGNHRALVVDIPQQVLYGEYLLQIIKSNGRKQQYNQQKVKDAYIKETKRQSRLHKIKYKIKNLATIASYPSTPHIDANAII